MFIVTFAAVRTAVVMDIDRHFFVLRAFHVISGQIKINMFAGISRIIFDTMDDCIFNAEQLFGIMK